MKYKECSRCVMDTSDPSITFDSSGVCKHCQDFDKNIKPYWDFGATGRERLEKLVGKIKKHGVNREFDCLLGLSGGIDSSYMLHRMVKEFQLRPLVFHVDGGWNSETAVHNIKVLVDKLKLDLYTEVIDWEEMRDFQLAWFKAGVPHIDIPQDHAFIATLYKFANKYNIKYILNGGNVATECVQNPKEFFYWGTDMRQIQDIRKKFSTRDMPTYPFSSIYWHKVILRFLHGVEVVRPLNYIEYSKSMAFDELEQEYGWKRYSQKHFESRFTRFLEGFWLPVRFGFDVRRVQFSSLILTGQMLRSDAAAQLRLPSFSEELQKQEFAYIASKLGIPTKELESYLHAPKRFYWDYKNQERMFELGETIFRVLGLGRRGGAM